MLPSQSLSCLALPLTLAFAAFVAVPQTSTAQQEASAKQEKQNQLSPAEIKSLNKKLRSMIEADVKYRELPSGNARRKARKKATKTRDAFMTEWKRRDGDEKILGSVTDLEGIYRDVFPYEKYDKLKDKLIKHEVEGLGGYHLYVPKSYRQESSSRVVVVMPGEADEGYADPRDYFDATWDGSALKTDTLFVVTPISKDIDMGAEPDFSRAGEEERDDERRRVFFGCAGPAQRKVNFDRSRLLLDLSLIHI